MKKQTILVSSLFVASMLVACNSNSDNEEEQPNTETGGTVEVDESDENDIEDEGNDVEDKDVEENDSEEDDTDENGVFAEGDFEDQLDLSIGDTGSIETLAGKYEITLNDVELKDEIDGQMSDLDYFLVVDYTLQNIGDDEIDAREAINVMESTDFLEGGGFPDDSEYYEQLESIEGTLASGEEISGEALYIARDADEYFIRITDGLVGSGAAKNQIRFTFQKSEIE